jgi:hypothetical protein
MYYSLVSYPEIENEKFHEFRNRYEPYAGLLPEHIAFIFPVPETIGLDKLKNHIRKILANWEPFDVHFNKTEKTFDHWLLLTPTAGNEKAVKLHDELYTGMLEPHLRKDLPYKPHIALGLFSKENYDFKKPTAELTLDKLKYENALEELKILQFDFWATIDELTLISADDDFKKFTCIYSFHL